MRIIQHDEPVWRDRANFIHRLEFSYGGEEIGEQIWTRTLGDGWYELCCITFYAYGLALGDHLQFREDLAFTGSIRPQGRQTVRLFQPACDRKNAEALHRLFDELGVLVESQSAALHAIDFPSSSALDSALPRLIEFTSSSASEFEHSNAEGLSFGVDE
ncbi:MAG: DUF4265 domain-containing protein [Fimbriimonadaceae bacterium]|nr:DUF4265 domain-containing protein [Fimbriimonadaceae bacterium]